MWPMASVRIGQPRATAGIGLDRGLAGHGADAERAALDRDRAECLDAVEIDQHSRPRQAEVEERHQALPAGEWPRVLPVRRQQGDGVADLGRAFVDEGWRLHRPLRPGGCSSRRSYTGARRAVSPGLSSPSRPAWSA